MIGQKNGWDWKSGKIRVLRKLGLFIFSSKSYMVSIYEWGPKTWTFFHTLVSRIKPESFPTVWRSLLGLIQSICANLPCPYCSNHATTFFKRHANVTFHTKDDMIDFFWFFHNQVNASKRKPFFPKERLTMYDSKSLNDVYGAFIHVYSQKDNSLKMLNESFRRRLILKSVHQWFMEHRKDFTNF